MMNYSKFCELVDWKNCRKGIFHNKELLRKDTPKFSYKSHVKLLPQFFLEFIEPDETPYRIFFYLCEPFSETVTISVNETTSRTIDFSQTSQAKTVKKFITSLATLDLVAIRRGRLAYRGWDKEENKPIFEQKKVDILLGLDIAHLTYNKLVDRILIFSYDVDLQPALKIARMGGLQIILLTRNLSRQRI